MSPQHPGCSSFNDVSAIAFAKQQKIIGFERIRVLLGAALSVLAGCHKPEPVVEAPTPSIEQKRAERTAEVPESMQRHWTFLNRIRQDDTFNSVIHRTMLNEDNQIGVVLFSSVKPEQATVVMDKVMSEMARECPHEDVTVAVYQVATPPKRIGTADLDGQTEKTTYIPEKI